MESLLTYNDRLVNVDVDKSMYSSIPAIRHFKHAGQIKVNSVYVGPNWSDLMHAEKTISFEHTFEDGSVSLNDRDLVHLIINLFSKKKELNSINYNKWEIEGFQMHHAGKQRAVVITVSLSSGYARSFLMPRICIKIKDTPPNTPRKKDGD